MSLSHFDAVRAVQHSTKYYVVDKKRAPSMNKFQATENLGSFIPRSPTPSCQPRRFLLSSIGCLFRYLSSSIVLSAGPLLVLNFDVKPSSSQALRATEQSIWYFIVS